jgi:hypothetical protein
VLNKIKDPVLVYITTVLKKIEKKSNNSQERKPSVLERKICRFFKQVLKGF